MQVFTDDGARIDARVDGSAASRVVVLIHGFPFASTIWDAQRDALAGVARVVALDLRGAGNSSVPDGPYLMERLAADVATLLDALGVERAALVGHSMGGYVALAFARMFTERVSHLALVASRLAADTPEQAAARRELANRTEQSADIEPVVAAYLPRLFSPVTREKRAAIVENAYAIARQTNPRGAAATLRGIALRAASDDIAADLDLPVLVVAGRCDETLPIAESRDVGRRFARAQIVECCESGHLPMLEEPERVSDALAGWLTPSE